MRTLTTAGLLLASAVAACAPAPNPSELLGGEPAPRRGGGKGADASAMQNQADPDEEGDTTPAGDAGPGTSDGGVKDSGPAVDAAIAQGAFAGAPPFVSALGPTTIRAGHNFPGNTPTTNPAGQACMTCHKAGGGAPPFVMGGTVYTTAAGTAPAANVEVRLLAANGTARTASTDANGNFFLLGANFGGSGKVGVRTGSGPQLMAAAVTAADCNSCHTGGGGAATARIYR